MLVAALEVADNFAAAHYNVARLYSRSGDIDRCLVYLDRALELAPNLRPEATDDENLGWVLKIHGLKQNKQGRRGE